MRSTARIRSVALGISLLAIAGSPPARAGGPHAQGPIDEIKPKRYTRNVAIILYPGAELLDFAGPTEVLRTAGWSSAHDGKAGFSVYTVGPDAESITSLRLMEIVPQYVYGECPAPDVIVIPGGQAGQLVRDEKYMTWLAEALEASELDLVVGTGVIVPATLGMLDGVRVTTHPWTVEGIRQAASSAEVVEDERVVEAPGLITTSGMSSSIDGALLVTARLFGAQVTSEVARYLQHPWDMDAAIEAGCDWLNPQLDADGRRRQRIGALIEAEKWEEAVSACEELVQTSPADAEARYLLGVAQQGAGDHVAAIKSYGRAAQSPRYRMRAMYNLACLYAGAGELDKSIAHLRQAVASGMNDKEWMRSDSDLAALREDSRFEALLDSIGDPRERRID